MAKKMELKQVASPLNSATFSSGINSNFDDVSETMDKQLSRYSVEGVKNNMESDLDMDSNRILNLPEPLEDTEPVRKIDVLREMDTITALVDEAETYRDEAEESRDRVVGIEEYVEELIDGLEPGVGTINHELLTNKDSLNQHPIHSITGLQAELDDKVGSEAIEGKQDKLIAGNNIVIKDNIISSIGGGEGEGTAYPWLVVAAVEDERENPLLLQRAHNQVAFNGSVLYTRKDFINRSYENIPSFIPEDSGFVMINEGIGERVPEVKVVLNIPSDTDEDNPITDPIGTVYFNYETKECKQWNGFILVDYLGIPIGKVEVTKQDLPSLTEDGVFGETPLSCRASTVFAGSAAWKALNGTTADLNDAWLSLVDANELAPQYIEIYSATPINISKLSITNRNTTDVNLVHAIRAGKLQYTLDQTITEDTVWVDIKTFSNVNNNSNTLWEVETPNDIAANYFRLVVTDNYTDANVGFVAIGNIKIQYSSISVENFIYKHWLNVDPAVYFMTAESKTYLDLFRAEYVFTESTQWKCPVEGMYEIILGAGGGGGSTYQRTGGNGGASLFEGQSYGNTGGTATTGGSGDVGWQGGAGNTDKGGDALGVYTGASGETVKVGYYLRQGGKGGYAGGGGCGGVATNNGTLYAAGGAGGTTKVVLHLNPQVYTITVGAGGVGGSWESSSHLQRGGNGGRGSVIIRLKEVIND